MAKQLVPFTAAFRILQIFGLAVGESIPVLNTVYVRNSGIPWGLTQLTAMANVIKDAWITNMLPLQNTSMVLSRIDGEDLGADPGNQVSVSAGNAGTLAGAAVSPAITALVSYFGDSAGVPRRGRLYFAGGVEADLNGNQWSSTYLNAVQDAFDALASDIGTEPPLGSAQVLVSRVAGTTAELAAVQAARQDLRDAIAATKRDEGVTNTLASPGIFVRQLIGTQRDRRT